MSQKIVRLSEAVINRIAAGEVIESPATLLKELIENSIDAGARSIAIMVEENGERLIRVEDDGCGMGREDAQLAIERHATSKITSDEDLLHLATMGFRGEALASIAAVSQLDLKTTDGGEGSWIRVEGGRVNTVKSCVRNRGTTIEVRSLFFNVPARKKFLKSGQSAAMLRVVETMALAHSEIAFSVVIDGKKRLDLLANERKRRIEEVLRIFPHEMTGEGIWGLLAAPMDATVQRREQLLFVNRRVVWSPLISKAVKMGYGTRLEKMLHPQFVLFFIDCSRRNRCECSPTEERDPFCQ